jgi:hypothetical protein
MEKTSHTHRLPKGYPPATYRGNTVATPEQRRSNTLSPLLTHAMPGGAGELWAGRQGPGGRQRKGGRLYQPRDRAGYGGLAFRSGSGKSAGA